MLRSYLRIFAWWTLFIFLGTLAVNLGMQEGWDTILGELLMSVGVGAAAAGIAGTINARRCRALAGSNPEGDIYSPHQVRKIKLGLQQDRAFHMISHYLREVAKYKVLGADQVTATIDVKTPQVMFRGVGSRITARVEKDGEGSLVTLDCRPAMPPAIIDFGQNLALVLAAENYLKEADRR